MITTGLSKNLALGGWRLGVARLPAGGLGRELRARLLGIGSEIWSAPAGPAVLRFDGSALVPLGVALELLLWVATAAALLGRRRWLDWWWGPLRRRRQARGDS